MVTIFDLKTGNILSLKKVLDYLDIENNVTSDPNLLKNSSKIIIPGVGSFDNFMIKLNKNNIIDSLKHEIIDKKKPFLGICVGMQILLNESEEGVEKGLGLIKGKIKKFDNNLNLRLPHMGWNYVTSIKDNDLLKKNEKNMFYFVHSYYPETNNEYIIATTKYGFDFPSVIQKDNIYGVQFHPEKSQQFGKKLLENFNKI